MTGHNIMKHPLPYLFVLFAYMFVQTGLYGQKNYYDSLLVKRVKVANPVYKPVVGIGMGSFSFLGDVQNNYWHFFSNNPGYRLTVSTYLDKNHYAQLDFNLLKGSLSGNQGTSKNHLNFFTDIFVFGVSVRYDFANLFRKTTRISPYFSVGLESFQFNTKGDLKDREGNPYIFASDGTIRNQSGQITSRDFIYESDLRKLNLYGRGMYSEYALGIPLEVGFDAALSRRVFLRVGTSLHITSTDFLDNVDNMCAGIQVNRRNDYFTFTFVSLRLDLFSSPEYRKVKRMFAEIPNDDVISGDEDHDWVLDFSDQCPASPPGVPVDSTGCPLDSDHDGIPDYLDREIHTPPGMLIDEEGRQVSDSLLIDLIDKRKAVDIQDMDYYLQPSAGNITGKGKGVPLKFEEFDLDHDNEISFEELLKAIDKYFDYRTFLSLQDIYELMDFYFSQ